jgi:hypothetical protein
MQTAQNDSGRIRVLNDFLRRTGVGGETFATIGIRSLPADVQAAILERVRDFSDFTEDNDPYGEHDFGSFEFDGYAVNWKVDYYDRAMQEHSPDAADSAVTSRVLTIMLAEEY